MKSLVLLAAFLTLGIAAPTFAGDPVPTAPPAGQKVSAEVEGIR
jgi:hypothetical protein